ncbi:TEX2 protein, partial [Calcarius ornatus]|nr:TEX2 protein [Calcarius ornatus]
QGWLNQLHVYDPELFHPSLTHSVLAVLDGATLKLSYPKSNIPRRATFEEEILDAVFISHRCYDLTDAKVFLCPPSLARKRTWNKKYPICVLLPEAAEGEGSEEQRDAEPQGEEGGRKVPLAGQDNPGDGRDRCLYLFGRTGREKEEWYQHLVQASRGTASGRGDTRAGEGQSRSTEPWWAAGSLEGRGGAQSSSGSSSGGSTEDIPSTDPSRDVSGSTEEIYLDYSTYMARFVPAQAAASPERSPSHGALGSPTPTKGLVAAVPSQEDTASMAWMNALVGRIFWDFLREQYWAEQVSNKIQKKLSKIKLPYFMNELTLTELDMGTSIPSVLSASSPTINERAQGHGDGVHGRTHTAHRGSFQRGLCPCPVSLSPSVLWQRAGGPPNAAGLSWGPSCFRHVSGNSTSRRILRFVDKIAKSKYFQKATENEFIKKKMEEVSNTPLLLTVEVQELAGTLAVNIPPPPTDRVWYSFRAPPRLELRVRPKLGEREVTFLHVTEWIEKKLKHEFQKILVMPNMDDLIVPIMRSGLDP